MFDIRVKTEVISQDDNSSHRILLYEFTQSSGSGLKNGNFRLQVTDPDDPLFLFDFELSPSEFPSLKEEQKLYCEFPGFSQSVFDLFSACSETKDFKAVLDQKKFQNPVLLLQQMTRISLLTHLKLILTPANPVRLNQYLSLEVHKYKNKSNELSSEVQGLNEAVEELKNRGNLLKEQCEKKLEENKKKFHNEKLKLKSEFESQIEELQKLNHNKLTQLEKKNKENELNFNEKYDKDINKLNHQIQSINDDKHKYQTISERQHEKIENLEKQIQEFIYKINKIETENKNLSSELLNSSKQGGSIQAESEGLKHKVLIIEENLTKSKENINLLITENESIKKELEKKIKEIELLNQKSREYEDKAKERDWIVSKSKQVIEKNMQELQKLKDHYDNKKKEWIIKEEKLKSLEIDNAKLNEREKLFIENHKKLEIEINEIKKKNDELDLLVASYKEQHESDQTVIDHLNNQLNKIEINQTDFDDPIFNNDQLSSNILTRSPIKNNNKTPGLSVFLQPLSSNQTGASIFDSPTFF